MDDISCRTRLCNIFTNDENLDEYPSSKQFRRWSLENHPDKCALDDEKCRQEKSKLYSEVSGCYSSKYLCPRGGIDNISESDNGEDSIKFWQDYWKTRREDFKDKLERYVAEHPEEFQSEEEPSDAEDLEQKSRSRTKKQTNRSKKSTSSRSRSPNKKTGRSRYRKTNKSNKKSSTRKRSKSRKNSKTKK